MSNEERSSVAERYSNKVPQPLNSQFPEHVSKSVAVEWYTQRKERDTTKLYPAGKESFLPLTLENFMTLSFRNRHSTVFRLFEKLLICQPKPAF